MNTRILLLALSAAALSSCGTMYKSGQTPDDVYYSPGMERAVVKTEESNENRKYTDEYMDPSDRYLRMKSSSQRWSAFDDDFMYWNNPTWNSQMMFNSWGRPTYGLGFGVGYGYSSWNYGYNSFWGSPYYLYNPFCPIYYGQPVVVVTPKSYGPRTYNLSTYNQPRTGGKPSSVYIDPKTGGSVYNPAPQTGTTANPGRAGVRVFSGISAGSGSTRAINYSGSDGNNSRPRGGYNSSDNSGRNSGSPTRTFEPRSSEKSSGGNSGSSGSRSGGSGSSGSSAPTRSFPRGGGN